MCVLFVHPSLLVATVGSFMLAKLDDRLREDQGRRRSESCDPDPSFLWATE